MRIFLEADHPYPAHSWKPAGEKIRAMPSCGPQLVHDLIAIGLAELGHQVFYAVSGENEPPPPGLTLVQAPPDQVDIYHNRISDHVPWIRTVHRLRDVPLPVSDHWVHVSSTLAADHGSTRFVRNGLNPDHYRFSETKDDYFLFLSSLQGNTHRTKYLDKGLDLALDTAKQLGLKLIVAGTTMEQDALDLVTKMCREAGATFLGDVRGEHKADLLAGARAVFFPTRLREGCPLVVIEALFSGTPVIAADIGVCREMLCPEVGFLCAHATDYAEAVAALDRISPRTCREWAMTHFHYRTMAAGYVTEYVRTLEEFHGGAKEELSCH